jgi:hypothetical protein
MKKFGCANRIVYLLCPGPIASSFFNSVGGPDSLEKRISLLLRRRNVAQYFDTHRHVSCSLEKGSLLLLFYMLSC